MRAMYGETLPVPARSDPGVADGDGSRSGDRTLDGVHTPGHASHHVALHDGETGALFTGEAIGSYLPWAPLLPAGAAAAGGRCRGGPREHRTDARRGPRRSCSPPTSVRSTTPTEGFDRGAERIRTWSERCDRELARPTPRRHGRARSPRILRAQAEGEFANDARRASPFDLARYDALGSIAMNAGGLAPLLAQALAARSREAEVPAASSGQLSQPLRDVERRSVVAA